MLRRKLLIMLALLTGLMMALAITALLALQNVFAGMDHINNSAGAVVRQANDLSRSISEIEMALHRLQAGQSRRLDDLIENVEQLRRITEDLSESYVLHEPAISLVFARTRTEVASFATSVGVLATCQDPAFLDEYHQQATEAADQLRADILRIVEHAQAHAERDQTALNARFRWMVIGIALGFLVVMNTSILLLLRTAGMILRPVDQLVEASRRLGDEQFDHRVNLSQHDEFDELARAYNRLAERLEENELRKVEMLHQAARTLNHELNNAIQIIDLQLRLVERQTAGSRAFEKYLHQIHKNLHRMTEVVDMLKHIRRVVLTDYAAGEKMLDLERSVREETPTNPDPPKYSPETT